MTCVSEQGTTGLLWTVFEGAPFSSRRIASFSNADEARQWCLAWDRYNDPRNSMDHFLRVLGERDQACEERDNLRRLLRDCPLLNPLRGHINVTDVLHAQNAWIDRAKEEVLKL